MRRIFDGCCAPSTLGSFLRAFRFGHVRQLDAVASRFLSGLAARTPLTAGVEEYALVDVDDTIVEVSGYAKQGSGYGYSGVRGLNALLATVSTAAAAPVVVAQRLRKGACGSPRGAKRLVADALSTLRRLRDQPATGSEPPRTLLRADSAFYGAAVVAAAEKAGADVSITVRLDPKVKAAIATIAEDAWTAIEYPQAVFDDSAGVWISRAESPRSHSSPSARGRRPSRCPAGWSCGAFPTSMPPPARLGKRSCSSSGGSTPSSPPAVWTPSPRTR